MILPIIFIFIAIQGTVRAVVTDFAPECDIQPENVQSVSVTMYMNGGTDYDYEWLSCFCPARADFSTTVSITVKVGADMACDDTGCCCTSYSYAQEGSLEDDCTVTYQYVCAQQILGDNFIDFLCCTTGDDSSFDSCLTDYGDDNVQDQINTCLATTGDQSPQVIAYNNAQEAINNGVDEPDVYEPYAFYDGVWTFCIDDYSVDYFTAILCTMLSPDVTSNIQTCQA